MRMHALVTGLTGLLIAGAAIAQTPPPPPPQPMPEAAERPEEPRIEPGASIRSSDGAPVGTLEGWRTTEGGVKEVIVRGVDGRFRAVPASGISRSGSDVVVAWTHHQFEAAPVLPPPPATPETPDD